MSELVEHQDQLDHREQLVLTVVPELLERQDQWVLQGLQVFQEPVGAPERQGLLVPQDLQEQQDYQGPQDLVAS